MKLRIIPIAAAVLAISWSAQAHAPKIGANGGKQADAGNYHVEILPRGTRLRVYVRAHDGDKPVSTNGFKGVAIFVVGGKPQRIALVPAGDNALEGEGEVPLPASPAGAVQITTPTGSTIQAKF